MAAWLGQAQAANLYPDKQSAVDASRSAHDSSQLISHPLRDTKSVSTNLTFLADRGAVRFYFSFPKNKSQVFCGKSKQNRRKNYFQKIYRCKRLTAALIDVWTAVASSAFL